MSVLWPCIDLGRNNISLSWWPFIFYLIGILYPSETPNTL